MKNTGKILLRFITVCLIFGIDLNRENIPDFDVREFYVQLVQELKKKGF